MTTQKRAWPKRARSSSKAAQRFTSLPRSGSETKGRRIRGVLFDRDGTIIVDVPYNGDPSLVEPVPHAKALLDRLRDAGVKVGVLTNQSGVGRGMISAEQMRAVNARVDALLGPFDGWFICPHAPDDDCECRKPKPKLVFDAAKQWGLDAAELAVVGDKTSDVEAARNAGALAIRVDGNTSLADAIAKLDAFY